MDCVMHTSHRSVHKNKAKQMATNRNNKNRIVASQVEKITHTHSTHSAQETTK